MERFDEYYESEDEYEELDEDDLDDVELDDLEDEDEIADYIDRSW